MSANVRFGISIFWVVLGIVLFVLSGNEVIDVYWSGMGGGLIGVGLMQIYRNVKYRTDENYREKVNIAVKDERNKYLSLKSWAWAGYIYVIGSALLTVVFKLMDNELLSKYCGISVCAVVLLYWLSYMFLKNKY